MIRILLLIVLFIVIARMFWRVVDNIIEGATGRPPGARADVRRGSGVSMVRDPICGTFVLPDRALSLTGEHGRVYFCSDACLERYRARPSSGSGRRPQGRTA